MGAAQAESLFGKQAGMYAAEDDPSALFPCDLSYFITTQGVTRVNADSDDIAGVKTRRIELLQVSSMM